MQGRFASIKFKRYVAVQFSGMFNMIMEAGQAMLMADLSQEDYFYIQENYKELKEKYPSEYEEGKKIGLEMQEKIYGGEE